MTGPTVLVLGCASTTHHGRDRIRRLSRNATGSQHHDRARHGLAEQAVPWSYVDQPQSHRSRALLLRGDDAAAAPASAAGLG